MGYKSFIGKMMDMDENTIRFDVIPKNLADEIVNSSLDTLWSSNERLLNDLDSIEIVVNRLTFDYSSTGLCEKHMQKGWGGTDEGVVKSFIKPNHPYIKKPRDIHHLRYNTHQFEEALFVCDNRFLKWHKTKYRRFLDSKYVMADLLLLSLNEYRYFM